jgi:exodeoxyribonuclease VII small subunit
MREKLDELRKITDALERDDVELEEAMRLYERGVALTNEMRSEIKSAEARVEEIQADGSVIPFDGGARAPQKK